MQKMDGHIVRPIGEVQLSLLSSEFDGAKNKNLDETQFVIGIQSSSVIRKLNGDSVKWLTVVNSSKRFKVVVRLSVGRHSKVCAVLVI